MNAAMTPESSDHFDGRRFFNPSRAAGQPFSAVPRMLLEPRARWPARVDQPPQRPPALDGAAAVVTFIGHATFLIQDRVLVRHGGSPRGSSGHHRLWNEIARIGCAEEGSGEVNSPVRSRATPYFLRDALRDDFREGTLAPFSRASLRPMAIACLRLVTFRPDPLFSVPFFFRRIAERTFFDADFPYFATSYSPASK
jgi:hypothetical protein